MRGCHFCPKKIVTLILVKPDGSSAEFILFICSRVSKSYLIDLYSLYLGRAQQKENSEYIESVIILTVDKISNPDDWLNCIVWSRYRQEEKKASLELFVKRPVKSEFYYAVGTDGTLLINQKNPNESIKIHENTVDVLCGKSKLYCNNPTIVLIDKGN